MHQAEAVRGVRAPIVVRPEPDVSIIVRLLFMIPAERVAAAFCGFRVEEYPPKEAPSLFNAGGGRALPLVRNNEHICQSAFKFDPVSASNFDPFERRVLTVALASSELAGVAETRRARAV